MKSYKAILRAREGHTGYDLDYLNRHSDPYWQAAMAAWRQIASHDCLPGMMRWLERADPGRYYWLAQTLPEWFGQLWGSKLEGFQVLLNEWVAVHRQACEDYKGGRATEGAGGGGVRP